MSEMVGLERFPLAFDVVKFGSIFGQPFWGEPVLAFGQRGERRLAGVDGPIIQNDDGGFTHGSRFRAMDAIEPFEQGDEIGAAFGLRCHEREFAGDKVERAYHGDFLRLARSLDAQVGSPFRPGAGKIGMGQRLRFIGEQQHNVARQRLLFKQLKTKAGSLYGLCVLPAFQRVTGPLAREAPFLRNTTDSRECEMRCPVRRSISSDRRGKVQLIRF